MDLTGEKNGSPQKPGIAYADLFTGLYSVVSILAGLQAAGKLVREPTLIWPF